VEGVHRAIARTAFGSVRRVPVVGPVARVVERVHDAIAGAVYASVRHGSAGAIRLAARAAPPLPAGRLSARIRSALNGTHGDTLAQQENPLAHGMEFHTASGPLPLDPRGLSAALPAASGRLCVFVHGLCCDESAWRRRDPSGADAPPYGERLREDAGVTPLYLRYNSGLPLVDNGRALAEVLHALAQAYPTPIQEIVLVGHSMGGLVALRACADAEADGLPWLDRVTTLVGLGVPLRGSPVAKVGHAATAALLALPYTAPLGALADARSVGVRDLRQGLTLAGTPTRRPIAYRFVGASVQTDTDGLLSRFVGDGLVDIESALPVGWEGDVAGERIGGMGHFGLLNDPRVYDHLARWLTEREAS